MAVPLDNYLRAYRKRAGLSQEEASQLVGLKNRAQFARYERHQSDPPLRVALACEQIFGVPTAQLFAGISTTVAKGARNRVRSFERALSENPVTEISLGLRYKLQWAMDCAARLGRYAMYGTP